MRAKAVMRVVRFVVAAIAATGCGADPAPTPTASDGTGTIEMALTSTSGSTTYVLANATFLVERVQPPPAPGDITGIRLHSSDTTTSDLTAGVDVGRYTVTILDGWQLQRQDSPTALVPVEATLQTMNPVTVSIFSGQTTFVTFAFQTTGIPITFGPGSLDVGVGVGTCDTAPPPGVELNVIANSDFEQSLDGWSTLAGGQDAIAQSSVAHCGRHSGEVTVPSGQVSALYALPASAPANVYTLSVWVRLTAPGVPNPTMGLGIVDSIDPGGCGFFFLSAETPMDTWVHMSTDAAVLCPHPGLAVSGYGTRLLIDDVYAVPR